jgi:6-phospho-beta-glucosidase
VANQELIVEAAMTGNRALALQSLVNDPLLYELDSAQPMLDEMLAANRRYLPRFFGE